MEEYDDKLNNWVMDGEHNPEEGSDQKKQYYQAMSNGFLRNSIHICLLAAISGSVISDPGTLATIKDSVMAILGSDRRCEPRSGHPISRGPPS
jgi:hypothetical protein